MKCAIESHSGEGRFLRSILLGFVLVGLGLSWKGGDLGEFCGILLSCAAASFAFITLYFVMLLTVAAYMGLRQGGSPLKRTRDCEL